MPSSFTERWKIQAGALVWSGEFQKAHFIFSLLQRGLGFAFFTLEVLLIVTQKILEHIQTVLSDERW